MPGQEYYLRLLTQAEKEAVVTVVPLTDTPTRFLTQLEKGYKRKNFSVFNSGSHTGYYSFSSTASTSGESMEVPISTWIDLPISAEKEGDVSGEIIQVYFFGSGEFRVEEMA